MIFNVQMRQIHQVFQFELTRLQRRRRADCSGLNFAGDHRADGFRRSAGLNHCNISLRIDAGLAQRDAGCEVRLRAEASRAEYLASQVLHPADVGLGKYPPVKLLRNGRDDNGIGAGHCNLNRAGPSRLDDRQFAG